MANTGSDRPRSPAVPPPAEEDGQNTWKRYCNAGRCTADIPADLFYLVIFGLVIAKWWHQMSAACYLAYGAQVALAVLKLWWCRCRHSSYVVWREAPAALSTALAVASPVAWSMSALIAQELGGILRSERPTPLHKVRQVLACTVGLAFLGRIHCVATGLGNRLRVPAHTVLHALLLARIDRHAHWVCETIISEASNALSRPADVPGLGCWYSALSLSLLPLPLPATVLPQHSVQGQCHSVVTGLRFIMGFAVPVALNAVWECREYAAYCSGAVGAAGEQRERWHHQDCSGLRHRLYSLGSQLLSWSVPDQVLAAWLLLGTVWFSSLCLVGNE